MKQKLFFLLLFVCGLFMPQNIKGEILAAGSVAYKGYDGNGGNRFTFNSLKDLSTDEAIYFIKNRCSSSYWVVSTNSNGCESERAEIVVTVQMPEPPVAVSQQVYTGTGTIANLTATGTNLAWYSNATGGTALDPVTVLVDGTTYYVSQSPGTTESARTPVTVKNISEATQIFCNEVTVANLAATPTTNATAKWFTSASGGTALTATEALATGTYYVEQTLGETTYSR